MNGDSAWVGLLGTAIGILLTGGIAIGLKLAELRSTRKLKLAELEFGRQKENWAFTRGKLEEAYALVNELRGKVQDGLILHITNASMPTGTPIDRYSNSAIYNRDLTVLLGRLMLLCRLYLPASHPILGELNIIICHLSETFHEVSVDGLKDTSSGEMDEAISGITEICFRLASCIELEMQDGGQAIVHSMAAPS